MCVDPNVPSLAGMKYDLRRVEEVYYDVKIRGLTPNGELVGDQGVQGQSQIVMAVESSGNSCTLTFLRSQHICTFGERQGS